jgi:hypothetical protein
VKTAALSWYSEFNGQRVKNAAAAKIFKAVRDRLKEYSFLGQKDEMKVVARDTLSQRQIVSPSHYPPTVNHISGV